MTGTHEQEQVRNRSAPFRRRLVRQNEMATELAWCPNCRRVTPHARRRVAYCFWEMLCRECGFWQRVE